MIKLLLPAGVSASAAARGNNVRAPPELSRGYDQSVGRRVDCHTTICHRPLRLA
jgi:hypothetical protein